jgi:hypothetical protein
MGFGRGGWAVLSRMLAVCLLELLPWVGLADGPPVAPPAECWDGPRDYYAEGEGATGGVKHAEERLHIDHASQALPEPMVVSPNGAYAYHLDYTPSGPASGATQVALLVFAERPYLVRLVAGDVFNVLEITG